MRLFLRFVRSFALPFWPWYLLGLIALYLTNQLTVLVPRFVKEALDALGTGDFATSRTRTWYIAGSAVAIIFIRTTSRLCFFNPGRAIEFRLKNQLFRHLLALPQSFHDTSRVGDLMSRATNDLQMVRALIGFAGLQLLEAVFILPLALQQMVALDAGLTGSILGLLLVALLVLWISAQRVVALTRENLEQLAGLSDHVLDHYSAAPVVQGFCAQPAFTARFDRLNDAYVANAIKISVLRSFVIPLVALMGSLGVGLVLWRGGHRVLTGGLTVGALVAYSAYIGILVARMTSFGWTLSVIQRGMVALQRVYALLDLPLEQPETRALLPLPVPSASGKGIGHRLEARGLTFTYPGSEARGPSLREVSFTLEPGETLGVFGHTGSGKSTLVHLLARVYTPPVGTLFLNGIDVCELPLPTLRELVTLVPQDPFLFSTSIRENILWGGTTDPPLSEPQREARLQRSLELACLENDLQMLTQGLDTVVGARGITLSGGQRQRVALARAFFRTFRILLLDDVLAAVDHQTEWRLIQNIYARADESEGAAEGDGSRLLQTSVIISHRVSALLHADQILVLEQGQVVDRGTHAELISRPGAYAETYVSQQESSSREVVHG